MNDDQTSYQSGWHDGYSYGKTIGLSEGRSTGTLQTIIVYSAVMGLLAVAWLLRGIL